MVLPWLYDTPITLLQIMLATGEYLLRFTKEKASVMESKVERTGANILFSCGVGWKTCKQPLPHENLFRSKKRLSFDFGE